MKRLAAFLSFFAIALSSYSQEAAFNRFTDRLTQQLETDAASAAARALYLDFAVVICRRASDDVANALQASAVRWTARNRPFLVAGVKAIGAIGERHVPAGGEGQKQGYLHDVVRRTVANAVRELERGFGGATPDNQLVPSPSRCEGLTTFVDSGRVDFANTPGATQALAPYMRSAEVTPK